MFILFFHIEINRIMLQTLLIPTALRRKWKYFHHTNSICLSMSQKKNTVLSLKRTEFNNANAKAIHLNSLSLFLRECIYIISILIYYPSSSTKQWADTLRFKCAVTSGYVDLFAGSLLHFLIREWFHIAFNEGMVSRPSILDFTLRQASLTVSWLTD